MDIIYLENKEAHSGIESICSWTKPIKFIIPIDCNYAQICWIYIQYPYKIYEIYENF